MAKNKTFYPCRPYVIHQNFGESQACVENKPSVPLSKKKVVAKYKNGTCPVGYISLYETLGLKGHSGQDLKARNGQPVYFNGTSGFVHEVCTETERGLGVGIITDETYEYEGKEYQMKLRYWHLKSILVDLNQKVKTGDLIGLADNTGVSAGDHLHYEMKPQIYFGRAPYGDFQNAFPGNGYYGGIDPEPYHNGKYADTANYKFDRILSYGDSHSDVKVIQYLLQSAGFFPVDQTPTGFYGQITAQAVYDFQIYYGLLSWWEKRILRRNGSVIGPKTLAKIKELYG